MTTSIESPRPVSRSTIPDVDRDGEWPIAALEPEGFLGLRMSVDLRGRPCDPRGDAAAALDRFAVWAFSWSSPRRGSCKRASSRGSSGAPSAQLVPYDLSPATGPVR